MPHPCGPRPPLPRSGAGVLTLVGIHADAFCTQRIGVLEKLGEDTAARQREQSAAMAGVAGKLQGVHDTVGALERELEGVKGDIARSARGVELLCTLVASSFTPRQ